MTMTQPSYAFTLVGIEPRDLVFRNAGEDVHRSFWQFIVKVGIEVKTRSLLQGLGADGAALRRLAPYTMKHRKSEMGSAEPDAPPLIPAGCLSRTISLLTGRAFADHAEWFWRTDPVTGLPWGRVLHWHRIGAGRLPVRDVIGLSFEDRMEIVRRGQQWWSAYQLGRAVVTVAGRRGTSIGPGHPAFPAAKLLVVAVNEIEQTRWTLAEGYRTGFLDTLRKISHLDSDSRKAVTTMDQVVVEAGDRATANLVLAQYTPGSPARPVDVANAMGEGTPSKAPLEKAKDDQKTPPEKSAVPRWPPNAPSRRHFLTGPAPVPAMGKEWIWQTKFDAYKQQAWESLKQFRLRGLEVPPVTALKGAEIAWVWARTQSPALTEQLQNGGIVPAGKRAVENAIQHAYWLGWMYLVYGERDARSIAWIHEQFASDGWGDTIKDFYNNNRGIEIAKAVENELGLAAVKMIRGLIDPTPLDNIPVNARALAEPAQAFAKAIQLLKARVIEALLQLRLLIGIPDAGVVPPEVLQDARRFWDAEVHYNPFEGPQRLGIERKPLTRP
jgi:hypothetical protein